LLAVVLIMTTVLAACSSSDDNGAMEETRTLRIGITNTYQDDAFIRSEFVDGYELAMDGKVQVELVNMVEDFTEEDLEKSMQELLDDRLQKLYDFLDQDNPVDVILFDQGDMSMLNTLVRENKLKQLDPLITEKGFDIEDFSPAVVNALKAEGDGNIYALAPTFSSSALVYNKQIFADAGVTPPRDGMTWQEVFALARQVTSGEGENRIYGFGLPWEQELTAYWVTDVYGAQAQLRTYDATGSMMTINTPQWAEAFSDLYSLVEENVWSKRAEPDASGRFMGDNFENGKLAMQLVDYNNLSNIQNMYLPEGKEKIEWDVVTAPVHPENPEMGLEVSFNGLVGINAKATNIDAAWDYVAFLNSKEWALIKSRNNYDLVSRLSAQASAGAEFNVDAFNQLQAIPSDYLQTLDLIKQKPGVMVVDSSLGGKYVQQMRDGELTVAEMLAAWEEEGNKLLSMSEDEIAAWETERYAD
jgi:multiple sugar transport system substrate-binding protein